MVRGHRLHPIEDRFWINLGAFGDGNAARFPNTSLAQTPPLRIGKNLTDSFISSGCSQRKGRQKDQLAPHQRRLIVDEAAGKTDFLKLIDSACRAERAPPTTH